MEQSAHSADLHCRLLLFGTSAVILAGLGWGGVARSLSTWGVSSLPEGPAGLQKAAGLQNAAEHPAVVHEGRGCCRSGQQLCPVPSILLPTCFMPPAVSLPQKAALLPSNSFYYK